MAVRGFNKRRPGRIIAVGIMISLAVLTGVTVMTHLAYQRAEAELVVERDARLTFLSAFRLKVELDKFSQTLEDLSRSDILLSRTIAAQRKASTDASFLLADFDGGVVRLDNFGRVVSSEPYRAEITNQDWSNREYFREMLSSQTVVFSNAVNDGPNGEMVVAVSVPIQDENSQFNGAMVGMFRLGQKAVSSFYASIVRLRLGQSGHTYVVDGNGLILFDSMSDRVGHVYSEETSGIDLSSSSGAVRTVDAGGNDIVASYASIPGTPWKLITEDKWVILNSPNRTYINWLLFAMILGIFLSVTGLIVFIRLRNRELDRLSEVEDETQLSRHLKQKLLPKQLPLLPGWNLKVFHQPAAQASGDYYDFMYLQDGRLMLVMAEVAGVGVTAMLKLATLRAGIRGAGQRLLSPAEALEFSSALICSESPLDASIKCVVGVFDHATGNFEFACAGNAQAFHQNGGITRILVTPGAPLGSGLENRYQQSQTLLHPGERILLTCDSIIQVTNPDGESFGQERLLEVLNRIPEDGVSTMDLLTSELRAFSGYGWEPEGDLTILLLESIPER